MGMAKIPKGMSWAKITWQRKKKRKAKKKKKKKEKITISKVNKNVII